MKYLILSFLGLCILIFLFMIVYYFFVKNDFSWSVIINFIAAGINIITFSILYYNEKIIKECENNLKRWGYYD